MYNTKEEAHAYFLREGCTNDVAEKLAIKAMQEQESNKVQPQTPAPVVNANANNAVNTNNQEQFNIKITETLESIANKLNAIPSGQSLDTQEKLLDAYMEKYNTRKEQQMSDKEDRVFEARVDLIRQQVTPDYKNAFDDLSRIAFPAMLIQAVTTPPRGNSPSVPLGLKEFSDIRLVRKTLGVRSPGEFEKLINAMNYEDYLINSMHPAELSAMRPGDAGSGLEFIQTLVGTQVIDKVRVREEWLNRILNIDITSNPYKLPQITVDMTFYGAGSGSGTVGDVGGGETAVTGTSSKPTTADVTFNAKKCIGIVPYDDDITEDSFLPVVNIFQNNIIKAYATTLAKMILRGDTTTGTTNINYDGGTPSQGAGAADSWLMWDGLVKGALDVGAGYVENAGAAGGTVSLALDQFEDLMGLSGNYGLVPEDNFWVLNVQTYHRAKTLIKNAGPLNPSGTIDKGKLIELLGFDVYASAGLPLTNDNGKISSTAANNDQKNGLLVYAPGVYFAMWKQLTFETFRERALQNYLVAVFRADMKLPYNTSTAAPTGLYLYNAD